MHPSTFSSYCPTRISFGPGVFEQIGRLTAPLGATAYIVGSGTAHRSGWLHDAQRGLEEAGMSAWVHPSTIHPDPTIHQVDEVAAGSVRHGAEVIVAIGGGSTLDCAKAAAAVAPTGGRTEDLLTGSRSIERALPVVAVPTTAGTGAELSKGAIVTWPAQRRKIGIRSEAIIPAVAIVDPELTLRLPATVTRHTGFDAFAHAVETFISRRATPMTARYSEHAVREITRTLPRVLAEPTDLDARAVMSFHAMSMGYNLANSSTCLPHRLQYPLGARTGTPHGAGLAALFPAWVEITATASPARFARVAGWIAEGMDDPGLRSDIVLAVGTFMGSIGLQPGLRDLGVEPDDLRDLAEATSGTLENDPWWTPNADLMLILERAMEPNPT